MEKQVVKRLSFREELVEYNRMYNKELNINGIEELFEEVRLQNQDSEDEAFCLKTLLDSYNYELDEASKMMREHLKSIEDIEYFKVYSNAQSLIALARGKHKLSKEEVEICIDYIKHFTILPITEENVLWDDISKDGELRPEVLKAFQDLNSGRLFKEVFLDGSERIIDIRAIAFSEDGGLTWFCNPDKYVEVTLPYSLKDTELIFLDEHGEPTEDEAVIEMIREKAIQQADSNEFIWELIKEHMIDAGIVNIGAISINKDELDSMLVQGLTDLITSKLGGEE